MIRGKELEKKVYEPEHVQQVLAEIEGNFPGYFTSFAQKPVQPVFDTHIDEHAKEQKVYREYLDLEALKEFEHDPNAFKGHTRRHCPIIRRCLMSPDEVMKDYQKSFQSATGRQLLDPVRKLAEFGILYAARFRDDAHENAATYGELGLEPINDLAYGCLGVIGYGIQSSLLYGLRPRNFAHRSQNALWSLYFLSGRKDFGLRDGSEFLMVHPSEGTCEQNYLYPAELFGFYSLKVHIRLKSVCEGLGIALDADYRYIYLSAFSDHVAEVHRADINTYKRSSEHVESQSWF